MNSVMLPARVGLSALPTRRALSQPVRGGSRPLKLVTRVAFTRVEEVASEPSAHNPPAAEPAPLSVHTETRPGFRAPPESAEALEELLRREYQRGFLEGQAAAAEQPPVREAIQDSLLRTTIKSLTWRVLSTGTTIALALALFHEANTALELGAVEFVSKYALFFIHERMWAAVTFLI